MTIPVTARLDTDTVEALDRAVAAGLGPHRGGIVSAAVREWLERHAEEGIAESYRRRYASPSPGHQKLIAKLSSFSAAACLAASER